MLCVKVKKNLTPRDFLLTNISLSSKSRHSVGQGKTRTEFMARRILRTKLCDMLGIEYPILCAGMGPKLIGETTGAPVELVEEAVDILTRKLPENVVAR
jgi:hypothetical protein